MADFRQGRLPGLELPDAGGGRAPENRPAAGLEGKSVWVVDAHHLIFQVFHGIPEMTSPAGMPVNAIYGFVRDVFDLWDQRQPDYFFCAFDAPGKTFRHDLFADYKGTRSEVPENLIPQFSWIRRVLDALGVSVLESEGHEADDILATLARITAELGGTCYVVSGDKDCRQLLSDRVRIFNIRRNQIYDQASLQAEWGIRPDQVVDFQALVGDSVDNVPGVPLIGPKTASELLNAYGTLDDVYHRLDQIKQSKRRENLASHHDQALLSRRLVRLDAHVPLELDWEAARPGRLKRDEAWELFKELGFRSFSQRMKGSAPAAASKNSPATESNPASPDEQVESEGPSTPPSPADPPLPAEAEWIAEYRTVGTPDALARLVSEMAGQARLSVDTETTSPSPTEADLVGLSFAWREGQGWYVPVRAPAGDRTIPPAEALAALKPILEDPRIGKVGQNLKYDLLVLRRAGVELGGLQFDTMLASYLLDAGQRNHNLDDLAERYLRHTNIKIESLIGSGKDQKRMDEVPVAKVAPYAAEDADVALRLTVPLERRLADEQMTGLFHDLEMPLIAVLADMEAAGIRVDCGRLKELSTQFGARMEELEQEIFELAGRPFNPASPKQLAEVLFREKKLPVIKKTKTGPSTDSDVLEELAQLHPLPARIIEHRQYAKLKGTYVDALPAMVNPQTGRVHCSFQQAVAATGRLSSSDPNLQNIPVRTEAGRAIRSAFLAGPPGWRLLAADYSQIELRILAHFSRDTTLCEAFSRNEDIHARVASEVYGVGLADVTPAMRRSAKAVNFGVIYGQSAFGLARQLGIEKSVAAEFIEAYFKRYPGVQEFIAGVLSDCHRKGYVETILKRRRAIREVRSAPGRQLNLSERTAVNTVIQGSAADLIKAAMISVWRRLHHEGSSARMLLQVHDELIFEVPPQELNPLAQWVAEEMSNVLPLSVPLVVDVKTGAHWAEVEPLG
jgi:DNA polymerase-1